MSDVTGALPCAVPDDCPLGPGPHEFVPPEAPGLGCCCRQPWEPDPLKPPVHQPLPGWDGCTCGTPGFVSLLSCGHSHWTHGAGRPGLWVGCFPAIGGGGCQASRKVITCTPGKGTGR